MTSQAVPEVRGIDLDFTPSSYFTERDLHLRLPSDIMGKVGRDMARRVAPDDEDFPPELLASVLSDDERTALGRIHPMLMGGEYLPPLEADEVEIARISLQSVTADQISVRARRSEGQINYTIVDEYGDSSLIRYSVHPSTSPSPLSLRELVAMLDSACDNGGAVMSHTMWHIEEFGKPEDYRYFATVESDFYPDLGTYYEARFDEYISTFTRRRDRASRG